MTWQSGISAGSNVSWEVSFSVPHGAPSTLQEGCGQARSSQNLLPAPLMPHCCPSVPTSPERGWLPWGGPGTQDGHSPSHASSPEDFCCCCCCLHHGGKCLCPENPVTLGPWVMPAVPITVTVKSCSQLP